MTTPKVMVALPTDHVDQPDEFVTGAAVAEMSRHLEALGFDAAFVTDHPAPDDRWLAAGGHHALEPTVALSFAAAATTRLRLVTNIYVLAYRNPLLAAKSLASLDVLSGGRLTVGVAAGYLRSEFAALGVEFDRRGALLDEGLDTLAAAWTGTSVQSSGAGWSARGNTVRPAPVQSPHPPIWCGGNSLAAMRRAVTRADGWLPFATPPGMSSAVRTAEIGGVDDLAARLTVLDRLCEEAGRGDRPTVCFTPLVAWDDADRLADEAGALGALGVDWMALTLTVPGPSSGGGGVPTRAAWMEAAASVAATLGLSSRS